jgi:2-polyprenyl-3-methyl-5-hydroxy-6-metoxy-1,4-benzoquinol methylase
MAVETKSHWEQVYRSKLPTDVSWYQTHPSLSLKLIEATGIDKQQPIIDVGGGASVLVDSLLEAGFQQLAVLDISAAAIRYAQQRLGARAAEVEWFETDVTQFAPPHRFVLWHDRAVFHFLTEATTRQDYVRVLQETLTADGHLIIATFAVDGPPKCSGLDVVRYDAKKLCAELGPGFALLETRDETHVTPWQTEQRFTYFRFRRRSAR